MPYKHAKHTNASIHGSTFYNSRNLEKPRCLPFDRGMAKKLWFIDTVEYYAAVRRDEVMKFSYTRMDAGTVMLSE